MYLICDIDGVLIPFPGQDGSIPDSHHRHQVTPTGHDKPVAIWLNPAHGPLINDLIADTGLRPAWCTSWRADAAALIAPRLGLPFWPHVELPRLPLTDSHPDGYLWKRDHLTAYLKGEPCAWIDDDFVTADHDWASTRTATGCPSWYVASLADGQTHLADQTDDALVTARRDGRQFRPLAALRGTPPDQEQICPVCRSGQNPKR